MYTFTFDNDTTTIAVEPSHPLLSTRILFKNSFAVSLYGQPVNLEDVTSLRTGKRGYLKVCPRKDSPPNTPGSTLNGHVIAKIVLPNATVVTLGEHDE